MNDTLRTRPDDGDDEWIRPFVLPEEYLLRHHPMACGSPYRRFESPNIVDLVRIRRERARVQRSSFLGHD
jgi:hypothetical protein